jgi:hypothetical protein
MNNCLEFSYFTIERERTARNIKTVTAPGYNLILEMAAFIAAILAGTRPDRQPPRRRVLDAIRLTPTERSSRTPGEPPCHDGK